MDILGQNATLHLQLSSLWMVVTPLENVSLLNNVWQTLGRKESDTEEGLKESLLQWALIIVLAVLAAVKIGFGSWNSSDSGNKKVKNRQVPVAKWPFPVSIPLIESLYNIYPAKKYGVRYLDMLAEKYGHFFEMPIGFSKCYGVSDATIAQKVFTSNNPAHLNKTKFFYDRIFFGALNDALVPADTPIWGPHRKILNRAFTYKSLQSYLGIMDSYSKRMVNQMMEVAGPTGSIEGKQIYEIKYMHTVKIIANIVMGADILTDEENRGFRNAFKTWKEISMGRLVHPVLMIDPIWWFHPNRRELDRTMDYMTGCIAKVIASYKARREVEGSSGVKLVEEQEEEDEATGLKPFRCMLEEMLHCGMSDKEIVDETLMMMMAGHETSTLAINTLMLHLANHPEYQRRCREEVDNLLASKVGGGKINEGDYNLTMDDLSNLKFVERCALENLRLTPTIPLFLRRIDEAIKIDDDVEIEKGTNVFLLAWSLHRNPEYYPEPEKFDPDRFLPENVKRRHPYAFMPFSAGQRNCIGWKMAMMEIKLITFWILRNFEIYTTDKLEDMKFRFEITLTPDKDIHLILKRRNREMERVAVASATEKNGKIVLIN